MSAYELEFWGDCANTWHEEEKQQVYAARMGLVADWGGAHPPTYDLGGRSVIDLGGGPVSLLLKCVNRGRCVIVDPADFPLWVFERYRHCNIDLWHGPAEEISGGPHFDEAWLYNVLQHVREPEDVVLVAREYADVVRVFEWVNLPPYPGHPHRLTPELLDEWLGAPGYSVQVNEHGCVGEAYYDVFRFPS
jgi:hypothetical protein